MTAYDLFLASGADDVPVEGIRKGTIALWRGADATDFSAAIDPLNNLGDVRFHSDFDYLRGIGVVRSTDSGMSPVSIGATSLHGNTDASWTLFAHGLDFTPLIIASTTISGYTQHCCGDMRPLPGGSIANASWRVISITADETNIVMRARGGWAPAMTVHWEVLLLAEEPQVRSEAEVMFRWEPGELSGAELGKVGGGFRFVHEVAGTGDFTFVGGREPYAAGTGIIACSDGRQSWDVWMQAGNWDTTPGRTGTRSVTGAEVEF